MVFRICAVTFLATVISFALALFFGIVTILLIAMLRGGAMDMTHAYRHVALPVALVVLVASFITSLITEMRGARRQKTEELRFRRVA